MIRKNIIVRLLTVFCITILCSGCINKKEVTEQDTDLQKNKKQDSKQISTPLKSTEPKYDLYSTTPYELPLFSVIEISKLSPEIKNSIDKVLEASQGFYFLRNAGNKVFIILQNPLKNSETFSRHDLEFFEIDSDGKIIPHSAGYTGVNGEAINLAESLDGDWIFDETIGQSRPIKHTAYDEKGKIKFIETWNYDETEPIKYQMKDSNKKIISILKESQENDSNYRKEHVFYDNAGNTTMSLTINYDGANISRLTFYNSHDLIDSISIITEYTDGLKTKEVIYNEDYTLVNTVTAEYINGDRKTIRMYDSDGKETHKISS